MALDGAPSEGASASSIVGEVGGEASARGAAGPVVQVFRSPGDPATRWRLISGNGREIGRSTGAFADRDAAVDDLLELVASLRAASVRIVGDGVRAWRWAIEVDGHLAVEASHAFDRRLRCEQAASLFLQLMPEADVRPGLLERGGRRSRSAVAPEVATTADVERVLTLANEALAAAVEERV